MPGRPDARPVRDDPRPPRPHFSEDRRDAIPPDPGPGIGLLTNAADAGTITIQSPTAARNFSLQLTVSPAGRTWGCVPATAKPVPGYRTCLP